MDLSKSYEYFQPEKVDARIHMIGCGSVGATIAENLVRLGLTNIDLWDMDVVNPHNLANQIFRQQDVGRSKVESLADILFELNPEVKDSIKLHPDGRGQHRAPAADCREALRQSLHQGHAGLPHSAGVRPALRRRLV